MKVSREPSFTDCAEVWLNIGVWLTEIAMLDGCDVPPAPEQTMEYVVLVVGYTETDPEVPEAVRPVPVHEVALVEDHVNVTDPPDWMDVWLAERVAIGVWATALKVAAMT